MDNPRLPMDVKRKCEACHLPAPWSVLCVFCAGYQEGFADGVLAGADFVPPRDEEP